MSQLEPDRIASVSAIPNCVRNAKSNELNSSSVVLEERGGISGSSLFDRIPSEREMKSMGFTLSQRDDVLHSVHDAEVINKRHYLELLEGYRESEDKIPDREIQKSKETGTYISKTDAIQHLQSYHQRHATGNENIAGMRRKTDCHLPIVHPVNDVSQLPFIIPHLCKRDSADRGMNVHSAFHSLLHCRFLHCLFIEVTRRNIVNVLYNDLQSAIRMISVNKIPDKVLDLEDRLKVLVERELPNRDSEQLAYMTSIISVVCDVKKLVFPKEHFCTESL